MEKEEVIITVKDSQFAVNKQALCEHSDYFRAMFSGNFKEHDQQKITLDIVDVVPMEFIIKYLGNFQNLSLQEYTLSEIFNLAETANILQFIELANTIESFLVQRVTISNWFELRSFAENSNYANLKKTLIEFGLPFLSDLKPQHVPSVQELVWYLSHTHLYAANEYDVFKFSLDWMSHSNTDIDSETVLMFLGCLDMERVTTDDLIQIRCLCLSILKSSFDHCLAAGVIQCLTEVFLHSIIITTAAIEKTATLKGTVMESARNEAYKLVEHSKRRQIAFAIIVPVINSDYDRIRYFEKRIAGRTIIRNETHTCFLSNPEHPAFRHYISEEIDKLYVFTHCHKGPEMSLDLDIKKGYCCDSSWDIAAWGLTKLVVVISTHCTIISHYTTPSCGSLHMLNIDTFCTRYYTEGVIKITVYNMMTKRWTTFNAEMALPRGRVRKIAIAGDSLYIFCDFGENIIYNLVDATHRTIARLPSRVTVQLSNDFYRSRQQCETSRRQNYNDRHGLEYMPLSTCTHKNEVYVSDRRIMYKYDEIADVWVKIIEHYSNILNMVSRNDGFIYVTDGRHNLNKFKPGTDETMNIITAIYLNRIILSCTFGGRLLTFLDKNTSIQEYIDETNEESSQFKKVWSLEDSDLKFDAEKNACSLAVTIPTLYSDISEYLKQCLARYDDQDQCWYPKGDEVGPGLDGGMTSTHFEGTSTKSPRIETNERERESLPSSET